MARLLKGKEVADALTEKLQGQVKSLKEQGTSPCLAIVRVGENASDLSYERGTIKRAEQVGVEIKRYIYEETITQEELVRSVKAINEDDNIHGVLIFRPLPKEIDDAAVEHALLPEKDIDGITEASLAGIFTGSRCAFAPCTARACMEMLAHYGT